MKKFLAIFPLCLLLSGLVFPKSEVKATEFVLPNTYEALPYVDLITALQSGATFDLTGDISSVEEFLEKAALKKVTGNTSDFSNGVINTSDRLWSEIKNEYMRRTIDNDFSEFLIPWHKSDYATNIGYDIKWYERYLDDVYSESLRPVIPSDYSWFANVNDLYLNGLDIWDSSNWYSSAYAENIKNYTLFGGITSNGNHHIGDSHTFFARTFTPVMTLSLNYSDINNNWVLSYSNYSYIRPDNTTPNNNQTLRWQTISLNSRLYLSTAIINDAPYSIQTTFDGFDTAINYIYANFANINLYVNDVPWILVGSEPDIVGFPDVIGTDYDDLAYDVVVPTDNNLAFDICKLYGWLYDNITQGLDNLLTWDDLISGGIIVDTDTGEPITDTDAQTRTKTEPVAKVIDDTLVGEGDGGNITPTPDPERIFPILPIDVSPIDNALGGSTILAEIVDATQNALPSELIDAFWGIVFILFIIGIIWTFHK